MKCQYCGTELPDHAKFCGGCGASFEEVQTAAETVMLSQQPETIESIPQIEAVLPTEEQQPETPEKPKKSKKKIIKVASIVAAVLVVVAAANYVFGISDYVVNTLKLWFMDPENYYGDVEYDTFDSILTALEDRETFDLNDFNMETTFGVEVTGQGKAALKDMGVDMSQYFTGNKLSATLVADGDQGNFSGDISFSVDDEEIVDASGVLDQNNGEFYYQLPFVNDQWAVGDMTGGTNGIGGLVAVDDQMSDLYGELWSDDNKEVIIDILRECLEVASDNLPAMTKTNETLDVNGVSNEYTTLRLKITEKKMAKVGIAVLQSLQQNEDLKDLIYDNEELFGGMGGSADEVWREIRNGLKSAIEELRECDDNEVLAVYTAWVDSKGTVMGREIAAEDDEFVVGFYNVLDGSTLATSVEFHDRGDGFTFSGQGEVSLFEVLSDGQYTLTIDESTYDWDSKKITNTESTDVITISVAELDLDFSEMDFTVKAAEDFCNQWEDTLPKALVKALRDYGIKMVASLDDSTTELTLSVVSGEEALLNVTWNIEMDSTDGVDIPDATEEAEDYMDSYGDNAEEELQARLKKAGVKIDGFSFYAGSKNNLQVEESNNSYLYY